MTDPPADDTEAREQDAPDTTGAKHRAPLHGHTGAVPPDKALSDTRSGPIPIHHTHGPMAPTAAKNGWGRHPSGRVHAACPCPCPLTCDASGGRRARNPRLAALIRKWVRSTSTYGRRQRACAAPTRACPKARLTALKIRVGSFWNHPHTLSNISES
eukprot:scaffold1252_cov124-Isochrysis_galbana.AAC.2